MFFSGNANPSYRHLPGPIHTVLIAGTVPLFLGAMLSDIAYAETYQIQWSNFASWLIVGGMVFCGLALLCALVNLLKANRKAGRAMTYFLLVLATWVLGLLNAFEHAKDAWATMPSSLVLSVIVTSLTCATTYLALTGIRSGDAK